MISKIIIILLIIGLLYLLYKHQNGDLPDFSEIFPIKRLQNKRIEDDINDDISEYSLGSLEEFNNKKDTLKAQNKNMKSDNNKNKKGVYKKDPILDGSDIQTSSLFDDNTIGSDNSLNSDFFLD